MPRLILHIGAHKTGTTALQQSLYQNRGALLKRGAAYVSAANVAHVHGFLGHATPGRFLPEGLCVLDPDQFAALLAEGKGDLVIASSENFSFFFQPAAIQALARALEGRFSQVRIVSYLRRQDRHAVSHHQEGAKPHRYLESDLWGHGTRALPEPSPDHALYLDYNRRLGLWADVFGDAAMELRVYDRALLKDGDIFADFLDCVGVDGSGLQPVGERNLSLGAAQTKAGHLLNAAKFRPALIDPILARIGEGGRLLPSRKEARAFLEDYRSSNRALNQRFGISSLPELFADTFDDLPETPQNDWTEDGATRAFQALLRLVPDTEPAGAEPTADDFRNAAIALQHQNPSAALRLINAAFALRPTGPTILKLKADLERQLKGA